MCTSLSLLGDLQVLQENSSEYLLIFLFTAHHIFMFVLYGLTTLTAHSKKLMQLKSLGDQVEICHEQRLVA